MLTSNARIASTAHIEWLANLFTLEIRGEGTRHLLLVLGVGRLLGANGLSGAGDNFAILH